MILASQHTPVLRTAGKVKRDNIDSDEGGLLMRTPRHESLQARRAGHALFISLLADLFPGLDAPKSGGAGRPKSRHRRVSRWG